MEKSLSSRFKNAFNAFFSRDPTVPNVYTYSGPSYSERPDRPRLSRGNERSIVTSVYNKIALDVASINFQHCKVDDQGRYVESIDSGLNECLNLGANIDQTGRAFIQDVVLSMFDEGAVAIVPVETTLNPNKTDSYDILSLRTGKIIQWYPKHVKVNIYNERTGRKEDLILAKSDTAIIENPFYAVMNEPNSTGKRLIRKLALLDATDEQTASGKLDLIVQLPYVIKSEARKKQAEDRRKDIEMQLAGSKYGIAYTDGTEKITQLNRSVENNLMSQIEYLRDMFYSQLCVNQSIMDGTADEKTMLNYNSRVVEVIASAIADEMKRKFLSVTSRSQNKTILYFKDPFKLVPVNNMADIADKFTRNEIMTSNELRQVIGLMPSSDPKADELRNSNLNHPDEQQMYDEQGMQGEDGMTEYYDEGGEYEYE